MNTTNTKQTITVDMTNPTQKRARSAVYAFAVVGAFCLILLLLTWLEVDVMYGGTVPLVAAVVIFAGIQITRYMVHKKFYPALLLLGVIAGIVASGFISNEYLYVEEIVKLGIPLAIAFAAVLLGVYGSAVKQFLQIVVSNKKAQAWGIIVLGGAGVLLLTGAIYIILFSALMLRACELSGSSKCM